nr:hypothetical protein [Tanacetum cinerariifolium]
MSRDVVTVGSTMRIPLLYRGEYSQWRERFMNYLEEQIDGETAEEKKTRNIDRLARSLLIQGLPNDIYSLIDSNETAKDLWDAFERQMRGSDDALYIILKQSQGDVNDALRYKKKVVMVTSDPLALVAEKTKVSKRKEKVVVSSNSKGSDADDISELKKITALLAKAFNRRKFYSKPTNNNLRTSYTSQSANKKQEFVKSDDKKVEKKADDKKRDMSKVKCYNCKKKGHYAKDYKKAKEINANMVFMAQIEKVLSESDESSSSAKETIVEVAYYTSKSESGSAFETSKYYDNSTNYGLFVNNDDDQEIFHDANESASKKFTENHIGSQKDYDKSEVDHNDSKEKEHFVDKLIQKFNHKIAKCQKRIEKANQQTKDLENQNKDLQDKYDVLVNHVNTFEEQNNEFNEQIKVLNEKNVDLLAQTKVLQDQLKQTSSLKPYVSNVILEKIITDLKDEVVSLLENEKANLKTIESLKSKGFELSENAISKSENQSENDCHVVEKECDKVENSKVIALGLFKLSVSQSVSPISMSKTSCDSKNVEKTSSACVCNDAMNVSCNSRMCDLFDENNLFIFDDESVRIFPASKMPFRKKPRDPMNVRSKSNLNKSLPRTVHRWLPKLQQLVEPIIQIYLWIIDSGCSKHMTGNRALLTNFVEKFLGTVRFGNNDFVVFVGYGDVGLEVAFRKSTCFVQNEDAVDFLIGDRSSNLYTIDLNEVASNSLTCLLAKASSSQSWLWHQRLSHLNFATINNLVKNNLVQGLPKMKFKKDHLCSACEQGKIHQKHHKSKTAFASNKPLYLLHMDLCGPMRDESINGKRYVLVVVDDYSRYIWRVRTDNGTEFKNKTLAKFFDEVGITQQFSAARTPQQYGVMESKSRTLVKAARTMLTFANLPSFFWAEAISTAYFTQNRLIIHKCFDKTPYELMNKRKPNIKFFRVFRCRCYLLNDYEDVRKLKEKGDIGVFVGYSKESAAFRVYKKQTRKINESVNVNFDEISEMAFKQFSLEPGLSNLNKTEKSSNPSVSQVSETSKKDLEDLFQKFYDEYFDSSKIMKSSTTNVETSINEEVFHEVSESFQGESSSFSFNDDSDNLNKKAFAPVARIEAIRLFLAYAAHKDFTVFQMDVKTAFLKRILKKELYVGQTLDFVNKQYPDHVYALDKGLYGLKQAPRAWYDVLSQFLIDSGF